MLRVTACRRWIAGVVAMLFLGTVLPDVELAQAPPVVPPHVRVQNVLKKFVKESGNESTRSSSPAAWRRTSCRAWKKPGPPSAKCSRAP